MLRDHHKAHPRRLVGMKKLGKDNNETPRVKTLGPPTGGVFLTGGLHPWAKNHTVFGTRNKPSGSDINPWGRTFYSEIRDWVKKK